jgi:hypothetical protein
MEGTDMLASNIYRSPHCFQTKNILKAFQIETEIDQFFGTLESQQLFKGLDTKDFRMGIYRGFGSGANSKNIRSDLECFAQEQMNLNGKCITYWAVFDEVIDCDQKDFEKRLKQETAALCDSVSDFNVTVNGKDFFTLGLHKNSENLACRFSHPTIVFNMCEQLTIPGRLIGKKTSDLISSLIPSRRDIIREYEICG